MTTENIYFSWKTKKTDKGYIAMVFKNTTRETENKKGQFVDSEILREDIRSTRAKAKSHAQKWVKYLKYIA